LSIISFREIFLILNEGKIGTESGLWPLKLLLCENHEVFGIELDEVSEYNRNKGGKGEERSITMGRSEVMVEMKVKLIGGELR